MDFVADNFFSVPDAGRLAIVSIRLITAVMLGGLLGYERESVGKAAGLRTHMLVALGAALFVIAPQEGGLGEGDVGRIIQGVRHRHVQEDRDARQDRRPRHDVR